MIKSNKRIEIVRSGLRTVSLMGQVSCENALAVLAKHYADVRITCVTDAADLKALVARKPDLVLLGTERVSTNSALAQEGRAKIWVAQYLDENGIAYTGSDHRAQQLGRDKSLAKQRVLDAGLRTAPFCIVTQSQPITLGLPLVFPLFVKPTSRGGGTGIDSDSVVHDVHQLRAKIRALRRDLQSDSLVEAYLPGREFSVAILRNERSPGYAAMPIELIAPADTHGVRILSGKVKSSDAEQAVAVTDAAIRPKVSRLAMNAFKALGGRDYGRIDIRLDQYGVPYFLEANLIPSLISGYGSFPKACVLNAGIDYEAMMLRIVRLGLTRNVSDARNTPEISVVTTEPYTVGATLEVV